MSKTFLKTIALLLFWTTGASAATLNVGSDQTYATVCAYKLRMPLFSSSYVDADCGGCIRCCRRGYHLCIPGNL
jgi:hypothetical protein